MVPLITKRGVEMSDATEAVSVVACLTFSFSSLSFAFERDSCLLLIVKNEHNFDIQWLDIRNEFPCCQLSLQAAFEERKSILPAPSAEVETCEGDINWDIKDATDLDEAERVDTNFFTRL